MKKTLANTITDNIKEGKLTMRTRLSVVAERLGLQSCLVIILGLLTLSIGFVLYWVSNNNDLLFGGYGRYGMLSFVQSFPYLFAGVFLLLFIFLIVVFRQFDISYKKPLSLILFLTTIGIVLLGWITIRQPFGQRLYQQEGKMFHMGILNTSNAVTGNVIRINQHVITIQNTDGVLVPIHTDANTHFPFGFPQSGDTIRSVGVWNGGIFNAVGVRVFGTSDITSSPQSRSPGFYRAHKSL